MLAAAQGAIRGMHPGTGDARYTIIDEWEGNPRNRHVLGSLCMAHKSAPNSGSCQFYFSLGEQPEFDDKYTVFGQVTEGLEVIEQLAIGNAIRAKGPTRRLWLRPSRGKRRARRRPRRPWPPSSASGRSAPPLRQPR